MLDEYKVAFAVFKHGEQWFLILRGYGFIRPLLTKRPQRLLTSLLLAMYWLIAIEIFDDSYGAAE